MSPTAYGHELLLDIHNCDPSTFNRDSTGGSLTLGHPMPFISEDLRFFVNYRLDFVDVSPATVKNDWTFAKAWLYKELAPDE